MAEVELLAGAAVECLVVKARRSGRPAGDVLDAGTGRVCGLVERYVAGDPAVELLELQARNGAESKRTLRRAADAIAERLESDPGFAGALAALVTELPRAPEAVHVSAASGGVAAGRDVVIRAEGGGIAAGVIGSVPPGPSRPVPGQA